MGVSGSSKAKNKTELNETEITGGAAKGFSWGYEEDNGANVWAKHFEAANGNEQSPINIDLSSEQLSEEGIDYKIETDYKICHAKLENNGHTLKWTPVGDAGGVTYKNTEYNLVHWHFHMPSEHTFNLEHASLELHFVHADDAGNLLVIGHCFNVGGEHDFIENIMVDETLAVHSSKGLDADVDFSLLNFDRDYIHYPGSLTTPPCSEGVQWFVSNTITSLSQVQLDWLREAIPFDNARPCQPINERKLCKRVTTGPTTFIVEHENKIETEVADLFAEDEKEFEEEVADELEVKRNPETPRKSKKIRYVKRDPSQSSINLRKQEIEEKTDFSWGYEKNNGPNVWVEYYEAANGKEQSPIDIDLNAELSEESADDKIQTNYNRCEANLQNNGHTLKWSPLGDAGSVTYKNEQYNLLQWHFHIPSEHTFNLEHASIELHFVHADAAGNLLVIGHCFNVGEAHEFIENIMIGETLAMHSEKGLDADVDFSLLNFNTDYIHYPGSLTTPPCSEGVQWFVSNTITSLSQVQLDWFREAVPFDNARPCQPINERKLCKRVTETN